MEGFDECFEGFGREGAKVLALGSFFKYDLPEFFGEFNDGVLVWRGLSRWNDRDFKIESSPHALRQVRVFGPNTCGMEEGLPCVRLIRAEGLLASVLKRKSVHHERIACILS